MKFVKKKKVKPPTFTPLQGMVIFFILALVVVIDVYPTGTIDYLGIKHIGAHRHLHLAFVGNSFLYYNDTPRMLEQLLTRARYQSTHQSCVRGGATLVSLWEKSCNVKFSGLAVPSSALLPEGSRRSSMSSGAARRVNEEREEDVPLTMETMLVGGGKKGSIPWDYIIMADQSQAPARSYSRLPSLKVLEEKYVPSFLKNVQQQQQQQQEQRPEEEDTTKLPIPIFIQTHAYRKMNNKFEAEDYQNDLQDFDHFTTLLREGINEYSELVTTQLRNYYTINNNSNDNSNNENNNNNEEEQQQKLRQQQQETMTLIAPVGEAYAILYHTNKKLWDKLYDKDNYHPSPYGTWLQVCILFMIIIGEVPPQYDVSMWNYSRDRELSKRFRPSNEEAHELLIAAMQVCKVTE